MAIQDKIENQAKAKTVRFALRISNEIHNRVKDLASDSHRSINNQYIAIVQEHFENIDKEQYYIDKAYDDENEPFFEMTENVRGEVQEVKDEIIKVLPPLRKFIQDKEILVCALENNLFSIKTFYDNNHHIGLKISLDTIKEKSDKLNIHTELLNQAKELLEYFHPIDPMLEYEYSPHPETYIPMPFKSLNKHVQNNRFIDKHYDQVNDKILKVHALLRKASKTIFK